MGAHDLLAGLGILIGLIGTVIVILPGIVIVVASVVVWALVESSPAGWVALALALVAGLVTMTLKYLFPGRRLRRAGIPTSHLLVAVVVALVGFFVIPVVGAFFGFVLAVYLLQRQRVSPDRAWPATIATLRAIALSIGIELVGGFVIATVWLVAAIWG
jgi:uncharacterized protein